MRKILLGGLLALAAVALIVTVAPAHDNHRNVVRAHLDGFQEVPAISTAARGKFAARINADSIDFRLKYQDFQSPVLFAHIHFAQRGVNGGVVAFLCGGDGKPACPQSGGTVEGTITAADVNAVPAQGIADGEFDEFVNAIKHGVTYANVHSDTFGSGEIRGQISGGGKGHFKGKEFGNGRSNGKGGHGGNGHDKDDH